MKIPAGGTGMKQGVAESNLGLGSNLHMYIQFPTKPFRNDVI